MGFCLYEPKIRECDQLKQLRFEIPLNFLMAYMYDSAFLTAEKSMMRHYKQQNFKLRWNPVNTVTNGPKKLAVLTSDRIKEGFFFTRKCIAVLPDG